MPQAFEIEYVKSVKRHEKLVALGVLACTAKREIYGWRSGSRRTSEQAGTPIRPARHPIPPPSTIRIFQQSSEVIGKVI